MLFFSSSSSPSKKTTQNSLSTWISLLESSQLESKKLCLYQIQASLPLPEKEREILIPILFSALKKAKEETKGLILKTLRCLLISRQGQEKSYLLKEVERLKSQLVDFVQEDQKSSKKDDDLIRFIYKLVSLPKEEPKEKNGEENRKDSSLEKPTIFPVTEREDKKRKRPRLGTILVRRNTLSQQQLENALEEQKMKGGKLGEVLILLGYLNSKEVGLALAVQFSLPYVDVYRGTIPDEVISLIPHSIAQEKNREVIPLRHWKNKILVAIQDPCSRIAEDLSFFLGLEIELALTSPEAMGKALRRYYGEKREGSFDYTSLKFSDDVKDKGDCLSRRPKEKDREPVFSDKELTKENLSPQRISRKRIPFGRKKSFSSEEKENGPKQKNFEHFLSKEAGKPGLLEHLFTRSNLLLKSIQVTIGLKFILLVNAFDIIVEEINAYRQEISQAWRMFRGNQPEIKRDNSQQQVSNIIEDLCASRLQLSRLFLWAGFEREKQTKDFVCLEKNRRMLESRFPLKIVMETRSHLNQMKQNLALMAPLPAQKRIPRSLTNFLSSFFPSPAHFFVSWRDLFVLTFQLSYSRREVEEMYRNLIIHYFVLIAHYQKTCVENIAEEIKDLLPIKEYEHVMIQRLDIPEREDNLEAAIEECQNSIQRLIQVLCNPDALMNPRKWSRYDLVWEMGKNRDNNAVHPFFALELERWLYTVVKIALKKKGFKMNEKEKQLRWREEKEFRQRLTLEKKCSLSFL